MIDKIKQVAVIGAGTMGAQIAMVCALKGYHVKLHDIEKENLEIAKKSLQGHMERRIQKGRLSESQVTKAFDRLDLITDLEEVRDADLIIEAVIEKLDAKRELFAKLDKIVQSHTILATNSSNIISSKIAGATERQDKVCNMHFFNPPLVMKMVEVVKGPHTSEETANTAYAFVESLDKTPVLLNKEISGFIANRILGKIFDEALFLYENGYANYEEIDLICKKALNHPIGPFALMDLTGIDVNQSVRMLRYEETGDERDKPSALLQEKVDKGELGRKTGKGFYDYSKK